MTMARKLCLHFCLHCRQSTLYDFLPRSFRKIAHSFLRYFGILGIRSPPFFRSSAADSRIRFLRNAETPELVPNCWFSGRFLAFLFAVRHRSRISDSIPFLAFTSELLHFGYKKETGSLYGTDFHVIL